MSEGGPRCTKCNHEIPASQIFPLMKQGKVKSITHEAIGQKCPPALKRCLLCGGLVGRPSRVGRDECPSGKGSGNHLTEEEGK